MHGGLKSLEIAKLRPFIDNKNQLIEFSGAQTDWIGFKFIYPAFIDGSPQVCLLSFILRIHFFFWKNLFQRERTEDSDAGASLFSGMTVTASYGAASDNLSLMRHTDVTPVTKEPQEQSSLTEIDTENIQGFAAVLGKVFKCPHYKVYL